jgi:hypothetical protein
MKDTEQNRREFEERFKHFDLNKNPLNGIYFDYGSEGAWQGWQAARDRQWMPIETIPKDQWVIIFSGGESLMAIYNKNGLRDQSGFYLFANIITYEEE